MPHVTVRYSGRACLLGEHCDWAGGSSLTVPLPLGIEIRGERARQDITVRSELDGELIEGRWSTDRKRKPFGPLRYVGAAIAELHRVHINLKPAELWIQSDLPEGRGFSSSAALTLGIIDALTRISGHSLTTADTTELAYQAEYRQLGIQCGRLDPAACAAGQPLLIKWIPMKNGEIKMMPHRVQPVGTLHLVVGAFDRPRNTKKILKTLNDNLHGPIQDPNGDAVREALTIFAETAEKGALAMQNGDVIGLGLAMDTAQQAYTEHLATRFASTRAPRLIAACHDLKREGALGAKFSGAGGDGSVVALFEDENRARAAAIRLEESDMFSWYVPVEAP